jgi:hypothetical protein
MPSTKKIKHKYETRLILKKPTGETKPMHLSKLHSKACVKNYKAELLQQPDLTKSARSMFTNDNTTIYSKAKTTAEFYEELKKITPKKPKRRRSKATPDGKTNDTHKTDKEAEVAQTPSYEP